MTGSSTCFLLVQVRIRSHVRQLKYKQGDAYLSESYLTTTSRSFSSLGSGNTLMTRASSSRFARFRAKYTLPKLPSPTRFKTLYFSMVAQHLAPTSTYSFQVRARWEHEQTEAWGETIECARTGAGVLSKALPNVCPAHPERSSSSCSKHSNEPTWRRENRPMVQNIAIWWSVRLSDLQIWQSQLQCLRGNKMPFSCQKLGVTRKNQLLCNMQHCDMLWGKCMYIQHPRPNFFHRKNE